MLFRLGQIASQLGGVLHGNPEQAVSRLSTLAKADEQAIAFLSNIRYLPDLATTRAACVILAPEFRAQAQQHLKAWIETENPYLFFAKLTQWWRSAQLADDLPLVHPSAVIHPQASVDSTARIGPLCVVERGASVGPGSWLKSRVTLGEDCRVGSRCILHSGVSVGADGFGFANDQGRWVKIEQLGAVQIGDDVEIGANSCIDRGALEDTVIGNGVKIDNLVQIGHNVVIGDHTALAGCAGVAGSARIGAFCTVGGGAVVLGHLELADHVHISAASVVMRSIQKPGQYSGVYPIEENSAWEKNAATLRQLHGLRERIRALESSAKGNQT